MYKFDVPIKLASLAKSLPDEFLEEIVNAALSHVKSPHITKQVKILYDATCRGELKIKGYRNASDVPASSKLIVKKQILDSIKYSENIFWAILNVWFDAHQELKETCQSFLTQKGVPIVDIQDLRHGFNFAILNNKMDSLVEDLHLQVSSVDVEEIRLMLTVLFGQIPIPLDKIKDYPGRNLDSIDLHGNLSDILSQPQLKKTNLLKVPASKEKIDAVAKDQKIDSVELPGSLSDILSQPQHLKTSFAKKTTTKGENAPLLNIQTPNTENKPSQKYGKTKDIKAVLIMLSGKLNKVNESLSAGNLEKLEEHTSEFKQLISEAIPVWERNRNELSEHVEFTISEIMKTDIHNADKEEFIKKIKEAFLQLKDNPHNLDKVQKNVDVIFDKARQFVKQIDLDIKNLVQTERSFADEEKEAREWGLKTEFWSTQLVTNEQAKKQSHDSIERNIKTNKELVTQMRDAVDQVRMELIIKLLKETKDLLSITSEEKKQRLEKINEKISTEANREVLHVLAAEIEKIQKEVKSSELRPDIVEAAKTYLREPDSTYLDFLINGLAKNQRHSDVYLLLTTVLAKGVWQGSTKLDKVAIDSYFVGFRDQTPQDKIFTNLVAQLKETQFVNQIKIEDPKTGLALAILYLSALAVRPDCLNLDDLWQIFSDDLKMLSPLWGGLLEQALQGNLPNIRASHTLPTEELNQVTAYLDTDFGKESGRYIRIRGKNSITMTNMETQNLLPLLDGKWAKLKTGKLGTDDWEQTKSWLAKTNETTLYDEVCRNSSVDPNESPFFRHKIEERIRKDLQYFDKFIKLKEEIGGSRINNFILKEDALVALQKAIQHIGETCGAMAQTILNDLGNAIVLIDEDETSLPSLIENLLMESESYWNTMPNAVAFVGNYNTLKENGDSGLIKAMVSSFTEPISGEELAEFYLRNNLPQIAEKVLTNPDIQDRASLLKQKNKELLSTRQVDLKKSKQTLIKTEDQWLSSQRWNLLFAEIDARLETIHNQDLIYAGQLEEKYTQFANDANKLEIQIMQASFIPSASIDELLMAVDEIRTVCRRKHMHCIQMTENLLAEVKHILDYKDTNLEGVTRVHAELKDAIHNRKPNKEVDPSSLTIGKYIVALRKGDYDEVGVNRSAYTESMIEDRIDLLNSWESIKGYPNSSLVTEAQLEDMRQFFNLFAKIIRVEYGGTPGAKSAHYFYRKPLPHFESVLMKPGADVLRRNLVFIALTDDVNPRSLKELDRIMDDEKWLKNGKFIIWFALDNPVVTHDWVRRKYIGKSVIVIDENALIRILFSGDNPTSTGVFKGMLLRTVDTHSVSVFWYENWVDNNKSIFVGREDWIRSIVESGQSHVIYGGRRIGKSSLLKAIEGELNKESVTAIYIDLEGARSLKEGITATQDILGRLEIDEPCESFTDFHKLITRYFVKNPSKKVMILFDELDPYIRERRKNKESHMLIETCRNLFSENRSNIRFVMAGFIELWKQLRGDGDISGQQNPYKNFLVDRGELTALQSSEAQKIVKEGFQDILGYQISDLSIPRRIVDATTGHPAFVQKFCERLFDHLHKLGAEGNELTLRDIELVRDESGPLSFTSFVVETLGLNINNLSQLLVYLIAAEKKEQFGVDDIYSVLKSYHNFPQLTKDRISESVQELLITGVFSTAANQNFYKFSVPSYSKLLRQYDLTDRDYLDNLIQRYTQEN